MYARAALACSLALFAAGCNSSPSVRGCSADADCGPGNACHQGSCAGNEPPTSAFSAPVAATTHRLVSLVPSSSDPEGRPMEHRWSIRAVVAGCDPDPEPGDGPVLDVVFWCPGTYEATLVSVDDLGAEGAPKSLTFTVSQATGAPGVTAGPAIASRHSCDLDLPACTVTGPNGSTSLNLSAVGADPGDLPLTWEWTASPPPGASADPGLVVSFASGSFVATPTVSIGNAGGPIAGVYRFRARVRNTSGLLAQAFQEVVVANGAPTASPGPLLVGHRYADGIYLAEGEIDTGASDPDGDLLVAGGALTPAPPAGCTEEVTPAPNGRVRVRIACSVATALIGASQRNLSVTVADANGAEVAFSGPLAIVNQSPMVILNPAYVGGLLEVDHRVEPCALATAAACFVADGVNPFIAFDPDGDPLSVLQVGASVAANKSASRGTATVDGATSRFRFETPTGLGRLRLLRQRFGHGFLWRDDDPRALALHPEPGAHRGGAARGHLGPAPLRRLLPKLPRLGDGGPLRGSRRRPAPAERHGFQLLQLGHALGGARGHRVRARLGLHARRRPAARLTSGPGGVGGHRLGWVGERLVADDGDGPRSPRHRLRAGAHR
jgi:hypothetical protein